MKLFWRALHELRSSRFSTALIIAELIFSIVCYQLCFSLTSDYLSMRSFMRERFLYNSVKVYYDELEDAVIQDILSAAVPEQYFTARHYLVESGEEKGTFITCCSDGMFDIAAELADIRLDLDGERAIPCFVPRLLEDRHPLGSEFMTSSRKYRVCGIVPNDILFYLSSANTGSAYILTSDRYKAPTAKNVGSCLFMKSGGRADELKAAVSGREGITGLEVFDIDKALKNEFAAASGILMIGGWIAVISTVGLLANNYLTYRKNERSYLVMLCVGAKKRDITVLYLLRMLLCIAVSLPIALTASAIFSRVQKISITGAASIAFAVGAALVIELISVVFIAVRFAGSKAILPRAVDG
ncbi:MAG: hypothetical protein IKP47_02935 [Ruminococcus sp.]|nr:hypothetical protein [Ruminococcus sp.]